MATKEEARKNGSASVNKLKDILNIQVEVTEKLLEAEEQKLRLLKNEIEIAKHAGKDAEKKDKEMEVQENTLLRIRSQYQRLAQEMQSMGLLHKRKLDVSRSLPAIGMKQTPKKRPSLFDNIVPRDKLIASKVAELKHQQQAISEHYVLLSDSSVLYSPQQLASELQYRDGVLVSGSIEALIQLLIPSITYYPERTFVFAFLLCSRLFIPPHQLLIKLSRIFQFIHRQQHAGSKFQNPSVKFVQLIREWTETFPFDFRDEKMMRALKEITQMCASSMPDQRREVGQLQSNLIQKLSTLDRYEHVLNQVNTIAMQRLMDPKTQINILRTCSSSVELAQQLTHIELERLNNIGPEEFIQTFIKSPTESDEVKKTTNIEAYVEWFNRLSYLVATEICVSDKERNRARLMEFFVDTALECKKLNNLNSFMAITTGLYMSPVARLKKIRAKLSSDKLETIENLLNPSNNFGNYRNALEAAITKTMMKKESDCVIPFFSLIIRDLYYQNESITNKLPNGQIRFEKCLALARIVSSVLTWKETVLPYNRNRLLLNYLMTVPIHSDDELLLVSYEIETPDNPTEKHHHQQLKGLLGSYARCIGKQGAGTMSGVLATSTLAAYPGKNK